MKASYKIALALSVAVCILAVFLIKGENPPDPTDSGTDITQADAATKARKTLRSEYPDAPGSPGTPGSSGSPTDGSVKSMVSNSRPQDTHPKSPSTIASDARNRILGAQGSTEPGTRSKPTADSPDTHAKSKPLNIGNNTTGPIALARTEAGPDKPEAQKRTTPPTTVSNKAVLDSLNAPRTQTSRPDASSVSNAVTTIPASANRGATTDNENTYIIQPGDTFSSIAIDVYNDEGRWVDIAQANSLVDPTRLKVGQVLRMPGEKQWLSKEEPSPPGPGGIQTYTIRAGDSLSTVADKYYDDPTLWRIIYNFNRDKIGDNPNAIQAGMTVKVPPQLTGAQ